MPAIGYKLQYTVLPTSASKTTAVIVAAGESRRMGGKKKQFESLCGRPVLVRSCEQFQQMDEISDIVIVARSEDIKETQDLVSRYSLTKVSDIVEGGATRTESVKNGFAAVKGSKYILIHDGARPLVTKKVIRNVLDGVCRFGAAACAVPVKDTIKQIDGAGKIIATPDRESLEAVQTPQGFTYDIFADAIEKAGDESFTDDCAMVEKAGYAVYTVDGSYSNIKITTPEDLIMAEAIIRNEEK